MGLSSPGGDRLLLTAAGATAIGILSTIASAASDLWALVTCIGYGVTCFAIHRLGRQGSRSRRSVSD